jgi:hypothetical protein
MWDSYVFPSPCEPCLALVVPEKNEEDKRLIELALHNNSLFTCLDEEQISRWALLARSRIGLLVVLLRAFLIVMLRKVFAPSEGNCLREGVWLRLSPALSGSVWM